MNKASGGDRIPAELWKILKDDAVKVLHSICQPIWKAVATGTEKVSFHSDPNEGQCQRMFKLLYHCTYFICQKGYAQILQVGLQQYVNCELPDVQTGLRKGRWARDQIANIHWIMEKVKEFQKSIYLCFINYTKAFDCVDHNKRGKFLKRKESQTL